MDQRKEREIKPIINEPTKGEYKTFTDMGYTAPPFIDFVCPYVNNNDKVWQKTFLDFCMSHRDYKRMADMRNGRYEDIGLINYQLRLVNKNMPFIRNIYLLLSNKEQAPKNLPKNVKVVLHKEFIPFKYLPTFNSTTIEMFLWNIPNLGEYFIYANDDMLPIHSLKVDDFFTLSGRIRIKWKDEVEQRQSEMFKSQCINSYQHTLYAMGRTPTQELLRPIHSFTPMIKSHCKEVFNLLGETITKEIRAFRTSKQHNQYIYPIYEHHKFGTYHSNIKFFYTHLKESEEELKQHLDNDQIICINNIGDNTKVDFIKKELEKLCE